MTAGGGVAILALALTTILSGCGSTPERRKYVEPPENFTRIPPVDTFRLRYFTPKSS